MNKELVVKAALAVDKLSTLPYNLDKPAEVDQIVGEAMSVIYALMNELKEKDSQ